MGSLPVSFRNSNILQKEISASPHAFYYILSISSPIRFFERLVFTLEYSLLLTSCNISLSGKVLCFTGSLRDSRSVCTVRAEAAGATVTASVTKKTTHLVAGPGAGGKVDEATAKGVVVWSEEEFFAMLNGSPTADSTTSSDAAPVKGKGKRIKAAAIKQEDTDVTPAPATKKGKTAKKVAEPAAEKSLDGASLTELVLCFSGSLCESRSVCTVRAEAAGASVSASVTAKVSVYFFSKRTFENLCIVLMHHFFISPSIRRGRVYAWMCNIFFLFRRHI